MPGTWPRRTHTAWGGGGLYRWGSSDLCAASPRGLSSKVGQASWTSYIVAQASSAHVPRGREVWEGRLYRLLWPSLGNHTASLPAYSVP